MSRIALATCAPLPHGDPDDAALPEALAAAGLEARWTVWDDLVVDWAEFDLVLVRSVWDYQRRRDAFLAWAEAVPRVVNPPDVLRRNTDKRYLADVPEAVATTFLAPGAPLPALDREVVVKPTVSAGSRDTARFRPGEEARARALLERIGASGRTAMIQPYLASVDERGETALVYFGGRFSHAVAKGPILRPGAEPTPEPFAAEEIGPRDADPDERALADALVARLGPLAYARVDLVRDEHGAPRVLELELTEPSLFFAHADGGEVRLARALDDLLHSDADFVALVQ